MTTEKLCSRCQETKPLDDFYRDRRQILGRTSECKQCHRTQQKQTSRRRSIKHLYGLDWDDYQQMLSMQDGLCMICGAEDAVHVDHDHKSGAVRAILCKGCNHGLGNFHDDPALLQAAIDYLQTDW